MNYTELLDNANNNDKIADLDTILLNIHYVVNQFRMAQARDTLRLLLDNQTKERRESVKNAREIFTEIRELIKNIPTEIQENLSIISPDEEMQEREDEENDADLIESFLENKFNLKCLSIHPLFPHTRLNPSIRVFSSRPVN
jgi:mediator of RNA polymerase II transcription subunit 7